MMGLSAWLGQGIQRRGFPQPVHQIVRSNVREIVSYAILVEKLRSKSPLSKPQQQKGLWKIFHEFYRAGQVLSFP